MERDAGGRGGGITAMVISRYVGFFCGFGRMEKRVRLMGRVTRGCLRSAFSPLNSGSISIFY